MERLLNLPNYSNFNAISMAGDKVRCIKEKETIFVFKKGSRKYGRRYSIEEFLSSYEAKILTEEEKEKKWHKKCHTIETKLEKSGLWPEIKELFHNLQSVSLTDREDIDRMHSMRWSMSGSHEEIVKFEQIRMNNIFEKYGKKYPFMFYKDNEGNPRLNTDYIWEISEAQTKSMYFGYKNAQVKTEIEAALASKESYEQVCDARYDRKLTYDVSYRYVPEDRKAFYSEEYRGCGNGHYYIALDNSSALFVEND